MTRMVTRNELPIDVPVPFLGMNTKEPPHRLPVGMGTDLYNVDLDEVKGIAKRQGFTQFNTQTYLLPKFNTGTIKSITGVMVYGSSVSWSNTAGATGIGVASDVFYMPGNSSAVFWRIDAFVGTATLSLATAYSQTVTAGAYVISPKRINTMWDYKYGTTQKLVVFAGTDGYYATAGATGSFTRLNLGLTNDQDVMAVTFKDKLYFCNGSILKSWDGSSIATVTPTTVTAPKFISLYTTTSQTTYLVVADDTTIEFSNADAPTVWSNDYYPVGSGDGSDIKGMAQTPYGLMVLKSSALYNFSGTGDSGGLSLITDDVGCEASKTIKPYKGSVYFLGRRGGKLGIFKYNGTSQVENVSESIGPTLDALSQGSVNQATAEIVNDYYMISFPADGVHLKLYIEREFKSKESYTKYVPIVRGNRKANALLSMAVSGTDYLFSGSNVNGFIYRELNGYADNIVDNLYNTTSAITGYAETSWLDFKDDSRKKELLRGYFSVDEPGDWNLYLWLYKDFETYGYDSYTVDLGASTLQWSEVVYGLTKWQEAVDKSIKTVNFRYPSFARYYKFRWINSVVDQNFQIYPMKAYYKVENT